MMKRVSALLFAIAALPIASHAQSPYYQINLDGATFEMTTVNSLTELERVGASASPAVIEIDGYRSMPAYALELRTDARTGEQLVYVSQSGTQTKRVSAGTGFFVSSDGHIVTNRHVVDDEGATYWVNTGEDRLRATIVHIDQVHDLAVLKVEGQGFPVIELSEGGGIDVGSGVASVGNALGKFRDTISSGRVLTLGADVVARDGGSTEHMSGLIATNARLYPGDSGGPLLDASGRAVGVNVAIEEGTGVSFSIPADVVLSVLELAGITIS